MAFMRGHQVPSFVAKPEVSRMAGSPLQQRVEALLGEALKARPDLFLIELKVSPDHAIRITLDGDTGISLKDCMEVSRAIEHKLDRDSLDFSLEVGSAGATAPLQLPRQFGKHLGRKLKVRYGEDEVQGRLTAADETEIKLNWKVREPKPVGKGKHTVEKEAVIPYSEIKEAKVVLKF